jgi:hypothetical protein
MIPRAEPISVPYATWSSFASKGNPVIRHKLDARGNYHAWTGHEEVILYCRVAGDDKTDFDANYLAGSSVVADAEAAEADIRKISSSLPAPTNSEGAPRIQVDPRDGNKVQLFSPDFTDKRTWWATSTRVTGETMTVDGGDNKLYHLPTAKVIVDMKHGRVPLEAKFGDSYHVKVYDNGVEQTEHSPDSTWNSVTKEFDDFSGGDADYGVDHLTGDVTFKNVPTGPVTIDYSEVVDSQFFLTPDAGKELDLLSAELQFSIDLSMQDTLKFELRGKTGMDRRLDPYWDGFYPNTSLAKTYTWDGTTTVVCSTNIQGEVKIGDWILLDSDGQRFEVDSISGGDTITILNPDTLTIPSGATPSSKTTKEPGLAGPYPYGTSLPLQTNVYPRVMDVISESNISYPLIKKSTNPTPNWRDVLEDIQIFRWDYQAQAAIKLKSSWGHDVRVWFDGHKPANGTTAIATFYCLSVDE